MTIYDYGRSPEHWMLAIDIASQSVQLASPSDSASELFDVMAANEFDVGFVSDQPAPAIVLKKQLEDATESQTLADFLEPIPMDHRFGSSLSLHDAFCQLAEKSWIVLMDGDQFVGLITRDDLVTPAASAFAMGHLITLERVLRRLIGSYTSEPVSDHPEESVEGRLRYFSQTVNRVVANKELRQDLGYERKQLNEVGTWAIRFRDHLAHSRGLNYDEPQEPIAVKRFREVQGLLSKAVELANDREQVWTAFADSQIVCCETNTHYTGADADSLPFASPCYIITAWNPFEQSFAKEKNQFRNVSLERCLRRRTNQIERVVGRSRCGGWEEESFLVAGIELDVLLGLAAKFGQRAIFQLDVDRKTVVEPDGTVRREVSRIDF